MSRCSQQNLRSSSGLALLLIVGCSTSAAWAQPDPGSGSAGSGSAAAPDPDAGSGSAGSAAGSGSGAPRIIQLPTDINAPQVSAAASPTVVRLGGKFTVFINATFGDGVEVNIPEPISLGSAFEVTPRKLSAVDRPTADGRKTREWQLEVIAWELGDLMMPPIRVTYTTFGKAGQVQTNAIKLKITGVLGDVVDDPKAIRDHAPPTELTRRDWFWLWIAGAAGAAVALLVGLILWRRARRRRNMVLVAGVVAVPRRMDLPSSRALEKLLVIEKSGVLDRDEDRKGGYTEMVEVIREYLSARYHISLADLTTRELMRKLARVAIPDECSLVETWLEGCDIVKYGGLRASASDAKMTLDDARALVITTTTLHANAKAAA